MTRIADAAMDDGIVCRMVLDVHESAGSGAAADLVELAFTPRRRRTSEHR